MSLARSHTPSHSLNNSTSQVNNKGSSHSPLMFNACCHTTLSSLWLRLERKGRATTHDFQNVAALCLMRQFTADATLKVFFVPLFLPFSFSFGTLKENDCFGFPLRSMCVSRFLSFWAHFSQKGETWTPSC